jgi:hypothetical protein
MLQPVRLVVMAVMVLHQQLLALLLLEVAAVLEVETHRLVRLVLVAAVRQIRRVPLTRVVVEGEQVPEQEHKVPPVRQAALELLLSRFLTLSRLLSQAV